MAAYEEGGDGFYGGRPRNSEGVGLPRRPSTYETTLEIDFN
jgi:polyadenylation factor subunit 2